ncbi:MAG: hypothetical protein Q8O76_04490 [Chloroflexota bacterium]|nr:hypothetical protein [Chloroflexota bacterium]
MRGYQAKSGVSFDYDSDFRGEMFILTPDGNSVKLLASDLLEFVARCYVAPLGLELVEDASVDALLRVDPVSGPSDPNSPLPIGSRIVWDAQDAPSPSILGKGPLRAGLVRGAYAHRVSNDRVFWHYVVATEDLGSLVLVSGVRIVESGPPVAGGAR